MTSYFIFVEKNPDKNKEDIYESLEEILSTVIGQLPVSDENSISGLENSFEENNSYFPDKNAPTLDFELSGLLDEKSQNFIKKYDAVMTKVFNIDRKI